jgi:hypothetical protein
MKNLLVACCLLLVAFPAQAAELFFKPRVQELGLGQEFAIDLMIDPQEQAINAVSANVIFPQNLLEVSAIQDGSSIITLWLERPHLKQGTIDKEQGTRDKEQGARDKEQGEIVFSGVIPGGFVGIMKPLNVIEPGKILRIVFKAKSQGEGEILVKDAQVLLHDGLGTPALVQLSNFRLLITDKGQGTRDKEQETRDITPPEEFTPEIANDPNIFEGKWFLVFATQDKGSGIDYYEVQETRDKGQGRKWQRAESPYLLKDQKLKSYIYVKAVDRAGNERIVSLPPRYPLKWYEKWEIWGIIILGIVIVYVVTRSVVTRSKRQGARNKE